MICTGKSRAVSEVVVPPDESINSNSPGAPPSSMRWLRRFKYRPAAGLA